MNSRAVTGLKVQAGGNRRLIPRRAPCFQQTVMPGLVLSMWMAGCQSFPVSSIQASPTIPLSYTRPPASGAVLKPQARLVLCDSVAGARSMAATGLFAKGCEPLGDRGGYRVINRQHQELDEGGVWLLEVQNPAGTSTFWLPIPWHDWA